MHAKHSDCRPKPVEVARGGKEDQGRAERSAGNHRNRHWPDRRSRVGAAAGLDTLADADALRVKISEMRTGETGSGRLMGDHREDADGAVAAMGCRPTAV